MGFWQWIDRAGFLGVSGSLLASGVLQGFGVLSLRIEIAFVVIVIVLLHAIFSSVLFTAFVTLSGFLFGVKLLRDHRLPALQTDGNHVAAIVPVYRDSEMLDRSVRSLLSSSYQNLSVWVVCEPDDPASQRRAETLAEHDDVNVVVNTNCPGTKADAINQVADRTDSEYVAVFDADEQVNPDFISHAVANLDDHDIVQGRTVPEPTDAIAEMAYYESVLLSYVARRLLYLFTAFRMASSRAVVMRRAAFDRVGGYDPDMLTEDFDFAYRCYTERLDVLETLAYPSQIEGAHSLRDWWGQRKRWMTGYAQVFHRLVTGINPRDYRSVVSTAICAGTIVGSGLMLSLLSKFVALLIVGAEAWFLLPVGTVLAVTLGVRLHDTYTNGIKRPTLYWLLTPVLFPLYGCTAIKAVLEYLLTWEGEWYSVEKTTSPDGDT